MKTWNKPLLEELSVAVTANGEVSGTAEYDNAGWENGVWHISTYSHNHTEERTSCGDGNYSISSIKSSPES